MVAGALSDSGIKHGSVVDAVVTETRAQKKFNQLDVDGSGTLHGDAVLALVDWVWSSFHDGERLTREEVRRSEAQKLLRRCHSSDGSIGRAEFEAYYEATVKAMERYKARFGNTIRV